MALETSWIKRFFPSYNILLEAGNSFGYKHTEDTKQRMKDNYSEEREAQIGSIYKGKNISNKEMLKLRYPRYTCSVLVDRAKRKSSQHNSGSQE